MLEERSFNSEENQQEKIPSDMTIVLPKIEGLVISAEGESEFKKGNYKTALVLYRQVSRKNTGFWAARVNEMLCEIRLRNYDAALLIFDDIIKNCENHKYLAQAYINKGDCLMGKSVDYSNPKLEKEACDSYHDAYKMDSSSIASIFYFWFAEIKRGNHQNAQFLYFLIEKHEDFSLLGTEQIRYFKSYRKTKQTKLFKEELVMNWKKLVLIGIFIMLFSIITLAADGVLNGG